MKGAELFNGQKTKKLYYSISEVAEIAGLEQHVIRYWESEFPKLKPRKNRAGNRQFREKDIQIIRYIKHLLHNDMYTVQGAKKKLMESGYKEIEGQTDLLAGITPPSKPVMPAPKVKENSDNSFSEVPSENNSHLKSILSEALAELKSIKKLLS